jgi:hypothetical protein
MYGYGMDSVSQFRRIMYGYGMDSVSLYAGCSRLYADNRILGDDAVLTGRRLHVST